MPRGGEQTASEEVGVALRPPFSLTMTRSQGSSRVPSEVSGKPVGTQSPGGPSSHGIRHPRRVRVGMRCGGAAVSRSRIPTDRPDL